MADYHILEVSEKDHNARVVFHIPVPVEDNSVPYSLQSAVSEHVGGSEFTSAVPWDLSTELTDIQNGLLYEYAEMVEFNANLTNVQKRTLIDNRFTNLTTVVVNRLRIVLKFWHLDRDVP